MNCSHVIALAVLLTVGSASDLLADVETKETNSVATTPAEKKATKEKGPHCRVSQTRMGGADRTSFTLFVSSEHRVKSIHALFEIVDAEGKRIGRFPLERKKIVASGLHRYSDDFVRRWHNTDDENSARFHVACMADEYINGASVYLQVRYQNDARKSYGKSLRFGDANAAPRKQIRKVDL